MGQTAINTYTKYSTLPTKWVNGETGEFTTEPRKGTYRVIETMKDYDKVCNEVFIQHIKIYKKHEAEQQQLF